ncbi:unannotated protein [freshwater metagenome]|uniref:Unannotated protein n=1 Tax=freshwater metagenome TaxID=449393 RepID=A0A6J6JLD6_9ZZZZ
MSPSSSSSFAVGSERFEVLTSSEVSTSSVSVASRFSFAICVFALLGASLARWLNSLF